MKAIAGEVEHRISLVGCETLRILSLDPHGAGPVGVFVHGFRSHGDGLKARTLVEHARLQDYPWRRFELHCHGENPRPFNGFRLSRALTEVAAVVDALAPRPVIIVGSSMGGWLAWLTAVRRQHQVAALLLVAPALGLAEYFLSLLDESEHRQWQLEGQRRFVDPYSGQDYLLDYAFIEDARTLAVNTQMDSPQLSIPVRILHGAQDDVVPVKQSHELAARSGEDATVTVLENEGHRLDGALDTLCSTLDALWPGPTPTRPDA